MIVYLVKVWHPLDDDTRKQGEAMLLTLLNATQFVNEFANRLMCATQKEFKDREGVMHTLCGTVIVYENTKEVVRVEFLCAFTSSLSHTTLYMLLSLFHPESTREGNRPLHCTPIVSLDIRRLCYK